MDDIRVSVAMATYNGEKYIKDQIDSILVNLKENDELIISDDGSTDKTLKIIGEYKDYRIKVLEGPRKGVKQNFANAIKHAKGKYIFLSDQDDVWMPDKVQEVLSIIDKENCTCVVHDCEVFDSDTKGIMYNSFFEYRNSGKGIIKNIWKNTYIGCCMAFKASIKDKILPIPNDIEMHDQWIGLLSEKYGKSVFIKKILIKYRRHNDNVSQMKHYSFLKMSKNRIKLIQRIAVR